MIRVDPARRRLALALLTLAMLAMETSALAGQRAFPTGKGWTNPDNSAPFQDWGFASCNPPYHKGKAHLGADSQGTPNGSRIRAIAAGTVRRVETGWPGKAMGIEHKTSTGSRFLAVYGHVSSALRKGDKVAKAQKIGTLIRLVDGSTNISHLHLGIRPLGNANASSIDLKGQSACPSKASAATHGYTNPLPWLASRSPGPRNPPKPNPEEPTPEEPNPANPGPTAPDGQWIISNGVNGGPQSASFGYGRTGDIPIVGDWNGDGIDTHGVFRGDGQWIISNGVNGGPQSASFGYGRTGDIPIVGDWNGDGIDTHGVFRGDGQWIISNGVNGGPQSASFGYGRTGDIPIVGDWNGDGIDTHGVFRGDGQWIISNGVNGGPQSASFGYGRTGDIPIVGDWNGDRTKTHGVVR